MDVTDRLDAVLANENDAAIAMYGGISAFLALNGAPRCQPDAPRLSPEGMGEMHHFMHESQRTRAGRRRQFPDHEVT